MKSQYHLAEEYIPKFICFLQSKDALQDNSIGKEAANSIFVDEFKPLHNITRFSFAKMFSYLRYFGLIKYNEKTGIIIFKSDVLHYVTPETDIVKRKKFKILPQLKSEQNSVLDPKPTVDESKKPSKKEKLKNAYTRKECNVCSISFKNIPSYREHQQTELHKLRMKYVTKIEKLTNALPGVVIEVADGQDGPEDILVRQNQPIEIVLNIKNKTAHEISIMKFTELNDLSCYVDIKELTVPCVISPNASISLQIEASFPEIIFYAFPIIFSLKSADSDKPVDALKELMFHVHSEAVDSLRPVQPYKRPPKPVISDAHNEIVRGELPKKTDLDFNPQFVLPQYRLPNNITLLLNNNLKEFSGMTHQQRNMLRDINKVLANFKEHGMFNKNNYFKLFELFLFMEEHQKCINIRNYDVDNQQLTPAQDFPKYYLELLVPGLAENRPSLLRGDSVFVKESRDSNIKYEGIVHKIKMNTVVLGFSRRFINGIHADNKRYSVSFGFNKVGLRAENQAIELANKHNVIQLLCAEQVQTKPLKLHHIAWYNRKIENNERQQQAVRHILSETARPVPYLIFGPPGTGKTVTIVEAILQIWSVRRQVNMLVCAPSNYAADEIAKRLATHVSKEDLFRYMASNYPYDFVDDAVKLYTNYKDGDYYYPTLKQMQTYRIVITTLVTAARLVNAGTPLNHFSYVFIDESAQATESETLIPIMGILTGSQKAGAINGQIVLAGDPKQLGPIIQSQKAMEYGYGISMLERLMNASAMYKRDSNGQYNDSFITKLVQNYRSHPSIVAVPNQLFYDEELVASGNTNQINVAVGWEHLPNRNIPIIFHSVMGKDEQEGNSPSFFNLQEVDIVVHYLQKLIGHRLNKTQVGEEHIGIIAPYQKQVQKLKQACEMKQWANLTIGSVEQFQGQEKMIIIVSTVRSRPQFTQHDAKFHLGFLKNPKRFNVAITRSRALLIVIGNPNILRCDEHWCAFIKYCKSNGCITGTPLNYGFCNMF